MGPPATLVEPCALHTQLHGEEPGGCSPSSSRKWRKAPQAPSRYTFITRSPCSTFCSSVELGSILGTGDVLLRLDSRMHLWRAER